MLKRRTVSGLCCVLLGMLFGCAPRSAYVKNVDAFAEANGQFGEVVKQEPECVNIFETPVAGSLVSDAALPRVGAAWVLEG